jgi:hypothetical protein
MTVAASEGSQRVAVWGVWVLLDGMRLTTGLEAEREVIKAMILTHTAYNSLNRLGWSCSCD